MKSPRNAMHRALAALPVLALAAAAIAAPATAFQAPRATSTESTWLHHGRDAAETRYSPLDQINADNVDRLGLAWRWEIPKTGARLETTPLIADGVLYGTGPLSFVFALDAATGAEIWSWDPAIPDEEHGGPRACCGDVTGASRFTVTWSTRACSTAASWPSTAPTARCAGPLRPPRPAPTTR